MSGGASVYSVQVDHIGFARDVRRGEHGAAWYLILSPCSDDPCRHVCAAHPRTVHCYERQAFRMGAFGHRLDATDEEIRAHKANVWGWDGNRDAPTLQPSFMAAEGRPYRLHAFLTRGVLELCSDSTVALATSPVPCWDEP